MVHNPRRSLPDLLRMLKRLFQRPTPEERFWSWFRANENRLFDFEVDREAIFDLLARELNRVDQDLVFEFGPNQLGKREFVISAGGIKRAFPAVSKLVASAPRMARWQVTAFRPRRWPINEIEFGGKRVDPDDVQFVLSEYDNQVALTLLLPGYTDGDMSLKQIGYLLLDETLGEYDVETNVGLIEMCPLDTMVEGVRRPLVELPAHFDELMSALGRPGQLN